MDISRLTNDELWRGLKELASRERTLVGDIVAYLAETQRRRLHEDNGWRSLFEYCVGSLRWSEASAFRRTRAAKAVLAYPAILEMLYDGRMHLEGLVMLYAFLEDADFPGLLLKAAGKTAKEVEYLVAERRPNPPERDSMRFVGIQAPGPAVVDASIALNFDEPSVCAVYAPTTPTAREAPVEALRGDAPAPPADGADPRRLVRFGFTADEELYRMVRRSQQLMRHKYPDGRLEGIFRDALKLLIEDKDLGLRAAKAAERKAGRHAAKARKVGGRAA